MKGKHTLRVQSAHLRYDMTFTRNLTVIQGDSATGKTTLVDMIQEYLLNGSDTGISLVCDCPCRVLAGNTWKEQLSGITGSIVFIDEGNRFVASEEFAEAVSGSDNYFVIVTREALDNLPYSVTEIYGIKSSGKYGSLQPVYHEMYRIYGELPLSDTDILLTEDSNSGYEFFSAFSADCRSAKDAGNIFALLQELSGHITVVADGAAFGSQMGRIHKLMMRKSGIHLYLPESFEWLILSSGILDDHEVREILEQPYAFIDSKAYISWERYFTNLLVEKSRGKWFSYARHRLNPVYLQGKCREQILSALPDEISEILRRTAAGESVYPTSLPDSRLGDAVRTDFTGRELDVLREMCSSESTNEDIAAKLGISLNTLRTHIKHILSKTGYTSRQELVARAREIQFVVSDDTLSSSMRT